MSIHHISETAEIGQAPLIPELQHLARSDESMVCFNISSSCRMLVLPELFVPKRPVIGASRICGMDRHDLKLVIDS